MKGEGSPGTVDTAVDPVAVWAFSARGSGLAAFVSLAVLAAAAAACGEAEDAASDAADADGSRQQLAGQSASGIADGTGASRGGSGAVSAGGGQTGPEGPSAGDGMSAPGNSSDEASASAGGAAPQGAEGGPGVSSLLIGDVPDVAMTDVSSSTAVSLRSLADGERPLLLWFWAPHCPVCKGEAPGIEQFARGNSDRLRVVGLGAFDDLDYARRFVDDTGVTFTMLWSDLRTAWQHYGVTAFSSFWLLDRQGRRIGEAPKPYDQALVEELLDGLT